MALTLRHYVAGTLLCCGLIAVAKLPPPVEPNVPWYVGEVAVPSPVHERVARLQDALRIARGQLSQAERRERGPLARARPGIGPLFITEVPLSDETRRAIANRLAVLWRRIGPTSPDIAVRITITEFGGATQALPPATDGRTCLIQLPLEYQIRWMTRAHRPPSVEQLDDWLARGLGPCAYYAAFGRPGPRIEQWLLDRSFDLAWETEWNTPSSPDELLASVPPILQAVVGMNATQDARYDASLDALACNGGDPARCRLALFRQDTSSPGRRWRHVLPGIVSRPWWGVPSSLFQGQRYLADLVFDMGRPRFEAFWRSPLPVDSAFHAAMGMSIEKWTARWEGERMQHLTTGSRIRWVSVLLGLLTAVLFTGAVTLLAPRRQVS